MCHHLCEREPGVICGHGTEEGKKVEDDEVGGVGVGACGLCKQQ